MSAELGIDRSHTGPRFEVTPSGNYIMDDDFHYDAMIKITGDWPSEEERLAYVNAVAAALNAANIPDGKP